MAEHARRRAGVARVFVGQPERLAAAWRRMRFAEARKDGSPPCNQLESVVEPFIREVGRTLEGVEGSAWSRTRAVLRLSSRRGSRVLNDEFTALRRCMLDAVETLGGGDAERAVVNQALDEAVSSTEELVEHLANPFAPKPRVPFAGLVVQCFEKPARAREKTHSGEKHAPAH
ncbi:hypothetical protein D187_008377 [Cystobacter fuscus DSM 2262]|uniref:Uncharacterized protein n=1 Tax=Cystobacter fuscus (strain ATCC 25194 / DSM 2262 / NBRC 100088 / M29) TaxID=1242864 RepID=S9NY43_CYSF2|nr:hypothetical protein [Cystobacter fuscus]EPX55816.1 hypothetical protein D187_008377 [Cystobacter fuscus DSM 2262]